MRKEDRECCVDKGNNVIQIRRVTWIGLLVNLVLSIIKFFMGVLGSSQALIADAFHSISDLSTDFAIIFGAKYWSKPPDQDHPYGHGRIETFITGFIGLVLIMAALGIIYHALATIELPDRHGPKLIALWAALISIVSKEMLYHYTARAGRRLRSTAVVANAWHHRSDALSSVPVAAAIAAASINSEWAYLDHAGALIVGFFIIHAAWKILRGVFIEVLDAGASARQIKEMEEVIAATGGVKSFHQLRSRRVGAGWYVDLHIQVEPDLSVKDGHNISRAVKYNLLNKVDGLIDITVHLEPYEQR